MDEAVSPYFAGQSSDDINLEEVGTCELGHMREEWEGKVYKGDLGE